ncbi:hypothetical protein [Amycolatopsis sp.]|uniref:hypothetical protein n=1 Tax=Amycolatopsis sp. TaxID=37632 RepID=UPI0026255C37|nr:hypothetical protein [Amycolatopsis sp.]
MPTHQHGRTSWPQLNVAAHHVFTDFGADATDLEAAGLMTHASRVSLVGAIEPVRSVPTVRDYLDLQFRQGDGQLLDGPSSRYPDVAFLR